MPVPAFDQDFVRLWSDRYVTGMPAAEKQLLVGIGTQVRRARRHDARGGMSVSAARRSAASTADRDAVKRLCGPASTRLAGSRRAAAGSRLMTERRRAPPVP
jgi:hypothetical protein